MIAKKSSAMAKLDKFNKECQKSFIDKPAKIQQALDSSRLELLDFNNFLNTTGIKLNKYTVDKFYHSIKNDVPVYLDNDLIKWCGFGGEFKRQKQSLFELIKKYNIPYLELDNDEYEEMRNSLSTKICAQKNNSQPIKVKEEDSEDDDSDEEDTDEEDSEEDEIEEDDEFITLYPPVDRSRGKGKTRHILIHPNNFRKIVLRLPTKVGEQVCDYYILLEQIVNIYLEYQNTFRIKREELLQIELKESRADRQKAEADRQKAEAGRQKMEAEFKKAEADRQKIITQCTRIEIELQESNQMIADLDDDINELTDRLDLATDDRVPKVSRIRIREVFLIMKLNHVEPDSHEFYVIRAQKCNLDRAIRKVITRSPNATRALRISCQPNSMNLYNRIKEQMVNNIDYHNNYISPVGITQMDFLREIRQINIKKKIVEVDP